MSVFAAIALAPLASAAIAAVPAPSEAVEVDYLYSLSNTFGSIPLAGAFLSYDRDFRELFAIGDGFVRVFNESGMEVFAFGEDPEVGTVRGVGTLDSGDLVVQAIREGGVQLVRCNFRGEFLEVIEPRGVPAGFERALLGRMRYQGGKIYLADLGGMRILVLDAKGEVLASHDVAEKLQMVKERESLGLRGFNVDREGNLLFTIQPLFRGYVMSPAGEIQEFGQKGSAPGKFNIVGGIARDDAGNLYVADILKSAILVFDREYRFVREFGYRGMKPQNLAAPEELEATGDGRLFVSQNTRRGVSVFQVSMRGGGAGEGSSSQ
ncbi:MAG TPA: hypothetical protein VLS93_16215 [Anaeromyxobacteraceae bacterium]|nr:hypothetical protein [Anaeromyxobacteraceae bacterium]